MKTSESIEAHTSAAVAAISQRNQATLPGFHKIFLSPVFSIFNRLAKASGFCLFLFSSLSFWSLAEAIESMALDPIARSYRCAPEGLQGDTVNFNTTSMRIV